jgi:hypothetical protein
MDLDRSTRQLEDRAEVEYRIRGPQMEKRLMLPRHVEESHIERVISTEVEFPIHVDLRLRKEGIIGIMWKSSER